MLRVASKYFSPPFVTKESKLATSPKSFPLQPRVLSVFFQSNSFYPVSTQSVVGAVLMEREREKKYVFLFNFHIQCHGQRDFPQSNSFNFESGLSSRICEVYTLYNYAVCMKTYRVDKVNPPNFDLPVEKYDGIQKALRIKKKFNTRDAEYVTTEYSSDDSDMEIDSRRKSALRPAVPKVPQVRKQTRTHYSPESDDEIDMSREEHVPTEPAGHTLAKPGSSKEKTSSDKKDSKGTPEGGRNIRNNQEKVGKESKTTKKNHVSEEKKAEERPVLNVANPVDESTGQQHATSPPVEMDVEEDISPLQVTPALQTQQGSENETNVYDLLDEPFDTSEITPDDVNILDPERLENLLMNEAISQPQRPRASSSRRSARKD
jgi:hypothetical protein